MLWGGIMNRGLPGKTESCISELRSIMNLDTSIASLRLCEFLMIRPCRNSWKRISHRCCSWWLAKRKLFEEIARRSRRQIVQSPAITKTWDGSIFIQEGELNPSQPTLK